MRLPSIDREWQLGLGFGAAGLLIAWLLFVALPGWYGSPEDEMSPAPGTATAPAAQGSTIGATLYYGAPDGKGLVGVEQEVAFHAAPVEQARQILTAQLQPADGPYVSVIPGGTTLRALYLTDRGDAFVDLSGEVSTMHPGGSLSELFTVYALVNALTVNLPAITSVQLLVEGHEVDTLAGHVDLRHPLRQNLTWVAGAAAEQSARNR
jgi:hypothetical protein